MKKSNVQPDKPGLVIVELDSKESAQKAIKGNLKLISNLLILFFNPS